MSAMVVSAPTAQGDVADFRTWVLLAVRFGPNCDFRIKIAAMAGRVVDVALDSTHMARAGTLAA